MSPNLNPFLAANGFEDHLFDMMREMKRVDNLYRITLNLDLRNSGNIENVLGGMSCIIYLTSYTGKTLAKFVKSTCSAVKPPVNPALGLKKDAIDKLHQQSIRKLIGCSKSIAALNFKRVLAIKIARMLTAANPNGIQQDLIRYAASLVRVHTFLFLFHI